MMMFSARLSTRTRVLASLSWFPPRARGRRALASLLPFWVAAFTLCACSPASLSPGAGRDCNQPADQTVVVLTNTARANRQVERYLRADARVVKVERQS